METATQALQAATDAAWASGNAQLALANATAYMTAFGHVTLAWLWLDMALKAHGGMAAADAGQQAFLQGKLDCARYFYAYELQLVQAWLAPVMAGEALFVELGGSGF